MKRCIALLVCLTLCFAACSNPQQEYKSPVNFYYRSRNIEFDDPQGVITCEQRESYGHTEDYEYLIEVYLRGPTTEPCISPFPAGTTLEQLDYVKDKVLIILSSHFALLSGADLTVACVCLGKTLSEMTGMKAVQISVKDELLDGKEFIVIKDDTYLLEDTFTDYTTDN